MNFQEITRKSGIKYRGPLPGNSPSAPWRITIFRQSSKIGTSGQTVGMSWQTYKNFRTEAEASAEMERLKNESL